MKKTKFFDASQVGLTFLFTAFLTITSLLLNDLFDFPFLPVVTNWLFVLCFILLVWYITCLFVTGKE